MTLALFFFDFSCGDVKMLITKCLFFLKAVLYLIHEYLEGISAHVSRALHRNSHFNPLPVLLLSLRS